MNDVTVYYAQQILQTSDLLLNGNSPELARRTLTNFYNRNWYTLLDAEKAARIGKEIFCYEYKTYGIDQAIEILSNYPGVHKNAMVRHIVKHYRETMQDSATAEKIERTLKVIL